MMLPGLGFSRGQYPTIYAVQRNSDGAIKVGFSERFWNRMKALRVEHGEIRLVGLWAITSRWRMIRCVEALAHAALGPWRLDPMRPKTEWFEPHPDALEMIRWWIDHPGWWRPFVASEMRRMNRDREAWRRARAAEAAR